MRFKVNRVQLVKELGSFGVDTFLAEFDRYCLEHLASANTTKFDVSLLRALCNVLENAFEPKHVAEQKLDKKTAVIDEYVKLKGKIGILYTADDRDTLGLLIEDLHNSGAIRKVPLLKLWGRRLKSFLVGTK